MLKSIDMCYSFCYSVNYGVSFYRAVPYSLFYVSKRPSSEVLYGFWFVKYWIIETCRSFNNMQLTQDANIQVLLILIQIVYRKNELQ
jgi:hypothetical protein